MSTRTNSTREPGLAEALARGLDPDEIVLCWAVRWTEDGRYHRVNFASNGDAHGFALTLTVPAVERYVVGTSAPRRDVHPPMVQS